MIVFLKIPEKIYCLIKPPLLKELVPVYLHLIEKGFKQDAQQIKKVNFKIVNKFGYEDYGSFKGMTKTIFIHFIYLKKSFLTYSLDEQCLMILHELTHIKQNEKFFNVPFLITWTDFLPRKIFPFKYWDDLLEFEALSYDLINLKFFPDIENINDKIKIFNYYGYMLFKEKWVNI